MKKGHPTDSEVSSNYEDQQLARTNVNSSTVVTLDDVAAQIMQIKAGDIPTLSQALALMQSCCQDANLSETAIRQVTEASQKIERLIKVHSTTEDAAVLLEATNEALIEVSRLIEAAVYASEQREEKPATSDSQADVLPSEVDDVFVREFITETRENLEGAEAALLTLETDPENLEAINVVFRAFHTLKGLSLWLGLKRISDLAHVAETLLSRARERTIQLTGGYADLALRSVDMFKALLQSVEIALDDQSNQKLMPVPDGYDELLKLVTNPEAAGYGDQVDKAQITVPRLGDLLVADGKITREEVEATHAAKGDDQLGMALVKTEAASLTDVANALRTQQRISGGEESSVRVRTERLDSLVDMVGELVIAQSMVAQDKTVLDRNNYDLFRKVAHAGKLVRELQDLSMAMRMVPLKSAFQKMARVIRDVAQKNGKQVRFITEGEETEIDRNLVDVISDPLMHMVRNAVDHGLELPKDRVQAGKPESGTVRLAAYHSSGSVIIELSDDGRGLNREKIIQKAIAKGLISPDRELTDSQVFNLIFEPGFSTAEQVTDISGRGVGMDVVRRKVEGARGRIDIASETGRGSTFTLRMPLTLAITDGMLVRVGQERYIIPATNIAVSLRPLPEQLSSVAGRGEMLSLRGELMPIFRLHRLFDLEGAIEDPTQALLVVVDDGERRCALLVDELLSKQQVVAKSLGETIQVRGITGGAILGDGRVGLILDPTELVGLARTL